MKSFIFLVFSAAIFGGCVSVSRPANVFEHTALMVESPRSVSDWWVRNLGFTVVSRRTDATETTFIVDAAGKTAMEFYRPPQGLALPDYRAKTPDELHFGFVSDDVDRDVKRLQAAGAVLERRERTEALDHAMLRDPFGLVIQFARRKTPVLR